jgi:cellulose synthase/poly-beta-1,6-N-acetylglucosamine synthase-like glycosyltransferase
VETVIAFALTFVAGIMLILVAVLLCEVLAAAILSPRSSAPGIEVASRPRIAVLVPAHNESAGLLPTIKSIAAQLHEGDRFVVVADNCSDDTASVAAAAGCEVIQRRDMEKVGKGFALDFGRLHLAVSPPEIVIVIDADCILSEGSLDRLAKESAITGRPAQALDLMKAPDNSSIDYRVSEFAWRVKNWVRPLGLHALNLPCQLMGTGMAFPWPIFQSAELATGRIVEDMKLGLDLALAGKPPIFCPAAVVTSRFPQSAAGAETQRQRWEHGHIQLILETAPQLLLKAAKTRDLGLFALALDMAIPPLILLCALCGGIWALAVCFALLGYGSMPAIVSSISLVGLLIALTLSWLLWGRDLLRFGDIGAIGAYTLGKFRIYCRLVTRGVTTSWVRTDRGGPNAG